MINKKTITISHTCDCDEGITTSGFVWLVERDLTMWARLKISEATADDIAHLRYIQTVGHLEAHIDWCSIKDLPKNLEVVRLPSVDAILINGLRVELKNCGNTGSANIYYHWYPRFRILSYTVINSAFVARGVLDKEDLRYLDEDELERYNNEPSFYMEHTISVEVEYNEIQSNPNN